MRKMLPMGLSLASEIKRQIMLSSAVLHRHRGIAEHQTSLPDGAASDHADQGQLALLAGLEAAEVLSVQVVPDLAAFNCAPLAYIDYLADGSLDAT